MTKRRLLLTKKEGLIFSFLSSPQTLCSILILSKTPVECKSFLLPMYSSPLMMRVKVKEEEKKKKGTGRVACHTRAKQTALP